MVFASGFWDWDFSVEVRHPYRPDIGFYSGKWYPDTPLNPMPAYGTVDDIGKIDHLTSAFAVHDVEITNGDGTGARLLR